MPEPILMSIAGALAARAATGLYELVKKKFSGNQEAEAALDAAEREPENSERISELATALESAEHEDPEFAGALRAEWQQVWQHAESGGVTNQISGSVDGKVVQARDIHGDISF
ncbi:MAG: hypothetical protein GEU98_08445 [Pseudonocardiaceae bacterium]|nr:hypothetical protein [Pseudonocardiaceae bacterium]